MIAYVGRRLLQLVPVLAIVMVTLFLLLRLLPGDPTAELLGEDATEEQIAEMRRRLGLDKPIFGQMLDWIGGLLQGDLGQSWLTREPVAATVMSRLPVTLELVLIALLFSLILGIPGGVIAAVRKGKATDAAITSVSMFFLAIPHFYLAILLILIFAVGLKLLPASGYVPFGSSPLQNIRYMILPATAVAVTVVAVVARQTRGSLLETLELDFTRTATAFGISQRGVVLRYALRNALVPVATVIGLQVGALMSATVVTESIFTLPGMGTLIVDAIFSRDLPIVQGAVLVVVLLVLLVNLLTDLLYAALDPRISYRKVSR
ncbi:ABC transporter permease [Microbacterium esteraromaticum]|uniref:ABC transporter permease n=1 Tax=Microbacterium esteraromaticum TaxID=57043 RepID=A0A7D7WEF9_9MICO|nr:ABC transporter permease [Microbacterium esteraromaticum]QMU96471.1 ABC transporter permease [Microbacterium esteraromaticum]